MCETEKMQKDADGSSSFREPPAFVDSRFSVPLCLGRDSARGANVCACAAVDACVGVDAVDVALANGFSRALGLAGSASHAVVADNVSHNSLDFLKFLLCYVCNSVRASHAFAGNYSAKERGKVTA